MRRRASRFSLAVALWIAALPASAPRAGVHFERGTSALDIPFRATNHQVLLRVQVSGRDSLWFALDTGATGAVIDTDRAAALGLEAVGRQRSLGAGGEQEGSTVHGVDLALPGLRLTDQTLDTLPLAAMSARAGRPLDGILGHSVFESCVVEIDYDRSTVSFHRPGTFHYRGKGTVLPLERIEGHPYVQARAVLLDGRTIAGRFVLDTGSSAGVILSPTASAYDSMVRSFPRTLTSQGQGVGGPVTVLLGRLERFELGARSLVRPIVVLQPPGAGRVNAPGASGNIGGGILSRFKVIFDYAQARLILEPGPHTNEPFEADMSGLVLAPGTHEDAGLHVARVQAGSPAASAGIEAGDAIDAVDGLPAHEVDLVALRARLRHEGQEVHLALRRRGAPLSVVLRTRRLL